MMKRDTSLVMYCLVEQCKSKFVRLVDSSGHWKRYRRPIRGSVLVVAKHKPRSPTLDFFQLLDVANQVWVPSC